MTQAQWGGPYFEDGKLPMDPWGNEYSFNYNANLDQLQITSNGPDGAKGTGDDIPQKQ